MVAPSPEKYNVTDCVDAVDNTARHLAEQQKVERPEQIGNRLEADDFSAVVKDKNEECEYHRQKADELCGRVQRIGEFCFK